MRLALLFAILAVVSAQEEIVDEVVIEEEPEIVEVVDEPIVDKV